MALRATAAAEDAKKNLLVALEKNDYEPKCDDVAEAVEALREFNAPGSVQRDDLYTGDWRILTKPNFPAGLGKNKNGDFRFTLGRMSFGMFQPSGMECSIQDVRNLLIPLTPNLDPVLVDRPEVKDPKLRTYDVSLGFTIEEGAYAGLKGALVNRGFFAPDPKDPTRWSVWFTDGAIGPADEGADAGIWRELFAGEPPKRKLGQRIGLWMMKKMMGLDPPVATDDGVQVYRMRKPAVGWLHCLYLDEDLRVTRGNRGTLVIVRKMGKTLIPGWQRRKLEGAAIPAGRVDSPTA